MPKPSRIFRLVVLSTFFLAFAFVFSGDTSSQSRFDSEVDKRSVQKEIPKQSLRNDTPHNLVGAFYDVENFMSAELLLNNKTGQPIEVYPTLYNLDGNPMEVSPVMVKARSHLLVNLKEWANLGGESFGRGSIRLFHTGKDLSLGTQIYLANAKSGLSFEERLLELDKFDSHQLESIWWMPRRQAEVTIILSNTSDEMLTVNARLSRKPTHSGETEAFVLMPHATRVLDLRKDFIDGERFTRSDIVGLSLEHTGGKSALKAHGQVKDEQTGYSSIISFSNPNSGKSGELHGTGLHLGTFENKRLEPIIAVKNVGNESTNVVAKVPYTRVDGTKSVIDLPVEDLGAGEMRLLNVNRIIQRLRREQIKIAGIEVKYDTAPGSLLVNVQSINANRSQVFRVPMEDPLAQVSSTGGYPWRIDETSRTVSYIKNMTGLEQEYVAYLKWDGSDYEYMIGIKKIAPDETVEIDVKKLRDEQIPDERGHLIPSDAGSGQIGWFLRQKPQTDEQPSNRLLLIGRSEQIDTINDISSSYACQNCCESSATQGFVSTSPFDTYPPASNDYEFEYGDTVQFYAYLGETDCYQETHFCLVNAEDWDSSDENVATVSSNGLVTIVGAGDIEIEAEIDGYLNYIFEPCGPGPYLTDNCDDRLNKEEKSQISNLEPPCGACDSFDYDPTPEVGLLAKPKVTNVTATGATKITQVTGSSNIIHFVTPKGAAQSQVALTATLSQSTQAILNDISWEGATESSNNPLEATLPKDTASKNVVKIKYKGKTIKELRVWVVWATTVNDSSLPIEASSNGTFGNPPGTGLAIRGGYTFASTIEPASIITDSNRPNFSGVNTVNPPGGTHPQFGTSLSGGVNAKWDISRQGRWKIISSTTIAAGDSTQPPFVNSQNYPTNDAEGNDDADWQTERQIVGDPNSPANDPYSLNGKLYDLDRPIYGLLDRAGVNGDTYEMRMHFRQFVRLEIEGNWYKISDFLLWRVHLNFIKSNGFWTNNSSDKALDNSGF